MEAKSIKGEEIMTEAEKDALILELKAALQKILPELEALVSMGSLAAIPLFNAARAALARVPKWGNKS